MKPVTVVIGKLAPLDQANVDTDVIMPKQYLKCISRFGYGDWAFDSWRYVSTGDIETPISTRTRNRDFSLNQPLYQGANILLTRGNFGCGSSREHAVWGIRDMGYKVILAPSFGDIFYQNCINNGLLPVRLPEHIIDTLFSLEQQHKPLILCVSLVRRQIKWGEAHTWSFEIDETLRQRLLNGQDAIAMTLVKAASIKEFESRYRQQYSFLFNRQQELR